MKTKEEDKIPQVLLFVKSSSRKKKKKMLFIHRKEYKTQEKTVFLKLRGIKDPIGNYNRK